MRTKRGSEKEVATYIVRQDDSERRQDGNNGCQTVLVIHGSGRLEDQGKVDGFSSEAVSEEWCFPRL